MENIIRVAMAKYDIAFSPDMIETQALGSCVGIVLYDRRLKLGGMAHAMLPDVSCAKESSRSNKGKFVNTSIEELLMKMMNKGTRQENIKAKLAGGANMFPEVSRKEFTHIGKRNVEEARKKLKELNIPVVAEETGGTSGRTIILYTETGILRVRTIREGVKEI